MRTLAGIVGSCWGMANPDAASAHHFQPIGSEWKSDCGQVTIPATDWLGGVPTLTLWLPDDPATAVAIRCGACGLSFVSPVDHVVRMLGLHWKS